jgi:hypothetical protein
MVKEAPEEGNSCSTAVSVGYSNTQHRTGNNWFIVTASEGNRNACTAVPGKGCWGKGLRRKATVVPQQ